MTEKWDLSRKDVRDSLPVDRNRLFPDARQDGLYVRVQNGEKTWAGPLLHRQRATAEIPATLAAVP